MKAVGQIRFEITHDGELAIRIQWDPQLMPFNWRQKIADELDEMATQMRENLFEQNRVYVEWPVDADGNPLPEPTSTQEPPCQT